ncbi:MAG: tyrosine-type recombinase/integrase, partial [Gemmatimonadaceae bacterium]
MSAAGRLDDAVARAFLLERFQDFLALEQGSSPRTSEAYARDLERLVTYASVRGAAGPVDITSRLLRDFVYFLKDLGLSPASIRRNVSAVRTYYRFLLGEGHVVRDPSERLETPRRWRTLPEVLSVDEVTRLLAAPRLEDPLVFRDRALLELAYGAGLRVSEWITLGVRDVLLEEQLVRVFGKGSKERLVPIGRSAIGAVAVYLRELRPRLEKGAGKGVLLLNARGEPMTRMGAWKILRKHVDAAGITKHVSPPTL